MAYLKTVTRNGSEYQYIYHSMRDNRTDDRATPTGVYIGSVDTPTDDLLSTLRRKADERDITYTSEELDEIRDSIESAKSKMREIESETVYAESPTLHNRVRITYLSEQSGSHVETKATVVGMGDGDDTVHLWDQSDQSLLTIEDAVVYSQSLDTDTRRGDLQSLTVIEESAPETGRMDDDYVQKLWNLTQDAVGYPNTGAKVNKHMSTHYAHVTKRWHQLSVRNDWWQTPSHGHPMGLLHELSHISVWRESDDAGRDHGQDFWQHFRANFHQIKTQHPHWIELWPDTTWSDVAQALYHDITDANLDRDNTSLYQQKIATINSIDLVDASLSDAMESTVVPAGVGTQIVEIGQVLEQYDPENTARWAAKQTTVDERVFIPLYSDGASFRQNKRRVAALDMAGYDHVPVITDDWPDVPLAGTRNPAAKNIVRSGVWLCDVVDELDRPGLPDGITVGIERRYDTGRGWWRHGDTDQPPEITFRAGLFTFDDMWDQIGTAIKVALWLNGYRRDGEDTQEYAGLFAQCLEAYGDIAVDHASEVIDEDSIGGVFDDESVIEHFYDALE